MWKNIGLIRLERATEKSFTSSVGIRLRRAINKPIRLVLKLATKGTIHVDRYPRLKRKEQYIFASSHEYVEEISAVLSTIDRSAYTLCGTTDQFEHNPKMYFNWLTGIIYVDRNSELSRKTSVSKMERIIREGSNVLLFPEGGLNNTENLLVQRLFAGPYILSQKTRKEVVPIATFIVNRKDIYVSVGDPLKLYEYDKKEALRILRDALASLKYNMIEQHTTALKRSELSTEARLRFMEERRSEYLNTKWTRDVWDEELTVYKDKKSPNPADVRECVDSIQVTAQNAFVLAPVLVKRVEDLRYDFLTFMHKTWRVGTRQKTNCDR